MSHKSDAGKVATAPFVRAYAPADEPAIRRVMMASLAFDAFPGISEWDVEMQLLSIRGRPEGVAVAVDGGTIAGYVSPRHDDLTVDPGFRRRGHGRRLIEAGLAIAEREGFGELRLWVPRTGPAEAFATATGLRYASSMWRLALPASTAVPEPSFPGAVVARGFGAWLPIESWVDLLNAAFAGHPGPVGWTVEQVRLRQAEPGFDPAGILLLSPADTPDQPVAFARVVSEPATADGERVGDIALVGVLPEWRGRGLGRELLRWGVAELRARGASTVTLNVEAENGRAMDLYRRTGFEPEVEWPHWSRPLEAG
jgi:mycothiol synthase